MPVILPMLKSSPAFGPLMANKNFPSLPPPCHGERMSIGVNVLSGMFALSGTWVRRMSGVDHAR